MTYPAYPYPTPTRCPYCERRPCECELYAGVDDPFGARCQRCGMDDCGGCERIILPPAPRTDVEIGRAHV